MCMYHKMLSSSIPLQNGVLLFGPGPGGRATVQGWRLQNWRLVLWICHPGGNGGPADTQRHLQPAGQRLLSPAGVRQGSGVPPPWPHSDAVRLNERNAFEHNFPFGCTKSLCNRMVFSAEPSVMNWGKQKPAVIWGTHSSFWAGLTKLRFVAKDIWTSPRPCMTRYVLMWGTEDDSLFFSRMLSLSTVAVALSEYYNRYL